MNFWLKIIFHYQGNAVFQFSVALALATRKPTYLYILHAQSICLYSIVELQKHQYTIKL